MSFHGIPKRTVERGDPYADECRRTAAALAAGLGLAPDKWQMTFQSRFGAAEWLQPYTQPTLEQMARDGLKSVDVICPGFPADCLETLEEISMECREAFLHAGGKEFNYIPCLNERGDWIEALADLFRTHLAA
jgi:ferrochelatase